MRIGIVGSQAASVAAVMMTAWVLAGLILLGCERPGLNSGAACNLNSDCAEPLACRLERCRRQCIDSRDCGAGLLCLQLSDELGGACQLPDESRCALPSDCPDQLVCRFGTCTTECAEDRDCPPGASCELDEENGASACVEPIAELCVYDSDCPERHVCTDDQRCEIECVDGMRDCPAPRVCVQNVCQLPDGG